MNIFENDKKFKEAIGGFIIEFSKLEYGLAFLCVMTEFDIREVDHFLPKYVSFSFEQKLKHLAAFINDKLPELKVDWDGIKVEIDKLNRERRYLVHGFMTYYLPKETITTYAKEGKEIKQRTQTLEEINGYINRLQHLNTGDNGILGEFHTKYITARINKWNNLVNDSAKVIYKVNSKIISEWTGKA